MPKRYGLNLLQATIAVLLGHQLILLAMFAFIEQPSVVLDPLLGVSMFTGGDYLLLTWVMFALWLGFGVAVVKKWPGLTKSFLVLHTLIAVPNLIVLAMFLAEQGFHAPDLWECLIMLSVFSAFYISPIVVWFKTRTDEPQGLTTLFSR